MNWIGDIVSEFGRRIGLPNLRLDDQGKLRMALEDGTGLGVWHISGTAAPEVVVYRSCPLAYLQAPAYRSALRLADFRQPNPWPVQAGVSQRELVLATRIPERAFSSTSFDQALERLTELIHTI